MKKVKIVILAGAVIAALVTATYLTRSPVALTANNHIIIDKQLLASQTRAGGDMTVKRLSKRSFVYAGEGATLDQQLKFWTGFSLFRDPWVTAPSTTKDRDGLGPLFNARSCIACHQAGSRAVMSEAGESLPTALTIHLGFNTPDMNHENNIYGGQIQPRVTKFVHGQHNNSPNNEAWLKLSYSPVNGQFSDGETYQLQKPSYELTRLGYGELPEHILVSPRFAPNIFGAGLLDAISDKDLLVQEDSEDINSDGISAKYNRVINVKNGNVELGRFGLKAKHPNLAQQVAAAFRDDIGITNSYFPIESCTKKQISCHEASKLGGHESVEIPDKLLDLVITFNRLLGVPPARTLSRPKKQQGQQLFHQLGCVQCHTPSYITDSNYSEPSLANQTIWPYTDLALHNMGEALADGVYEYKATGTEWRTPPLWGIGLQKTVTGQQRFLHDGRARTITEAILWHGGEAKPAQTKFKNLTKDQRQALLMFLKSI
jgi:CxxC motif-containing protein (DUF1111 family)